MNQANTNAKKKNCFMQKNKNDQSSRWNEIKSEIQNQNIFKQSKSIFNKRHYGENDRDRRSFFKRQIQVVKPKIEFDLEKMNNDFPSLSESINKLK